jgi:glutamate/tyrosine decarboxylase-like PLP-dependent enzyme
VIGDPVSPIVAFTTSSTAKFDIYQVADAMRERHWHLDILQRPKGYTNKYNSSSRLFVIVIVRDHVRLKAMLSTELSSDLTILFFFSLSLS